MTSTASGFESTSTYRRPSSRHTAPSVPEPAKKSRHHPPGRDDAVTIRERDEMTQDRVSLDKVVEYLGARLPGC